MDELDREWSEMQRPWIAGARRNEAEWEEMARAMGGKLMVHIGEGERPILIDVRRPPMNEDEVLIPAPRERLRLHAKLGELLIGAFGGLIAALIILWMAAR